MPELSKLPILLLFPAALVLTPASLCHAEDSELVQLFDGRTLSGWDGDERFWRVEEGSIIGETTAEVSAEKNTFLIFRDGEFGDFILRLKYKVRGYNSGVQYRSVETGPWSVSGYQCDFEARWHQDGTTDKFTGMLYDEAGRGFLARRGQATLVGPPADGAKKPTTTLLANLGDTVDLEKGIDRDGWNELTVCANGSQLTHIVNGRVFAAAWDTDAERRRASGLIALQLHSGPPMRIDVRDISVEVIKN